MIILTTPEEKKKYVQQFNVFDDAFFEMVAKDKEAVEDILRIILHDPELVVTKLIPQNSVKNLYGRSVRLDALCVTGDGRHINVEVQKENNDNHAKRVRYNASCITANVSFSISDGEHLIYANASKDVDAEAEDDDVAELMEFFKNSQGQNDKFRRLTNRVHDLKNNESEVNTMCKLVEDFAKEYAKEYAKEQAKEMICGLVRKGALSPEIGAEQLELSMEDFYELLNGTKQAV